MKFEAAQKAYAVFGALFIPLLALTLLSLGRRPELPRTLRNGPLATALLVVALAIFALAGVLGAARKLGL